MAVNLHDSAYEMEKAIRNSDEYKTLRRLYDEVNADPSAKQMFEKFRQYADADAAEANDGAGNHPAGSRTGTADCGACSAASENFAVDGS